MKEQDTKVKEKPIQVSFYLNSKEEKQKLHEIANFYGLGASAYLRMMIIKEWRDKLKYTEKGQ